MQQRSFAEFCLRPPAPLTGRDEDWTEFDMAGAAKFYQGLMTSKGHRELITWYSEICQLRSWRGLSVNPPGRLLGWRQPIVPPDGFLIICQKPRKLINEMLALFIVFVFNHKAICAPFITDIRSATHSSLDLS